MFVDIMFSPISVAEWPHFRKELPTRLPICSLCTLTICNFSYFPIWISGLDLGSDCFNSWSWHTFNSKLNGDIRTKSVLIRDFNLVSSIKALTFTVRKFSSWLSQCDILVVDQ